MQRKDKDVWSIVRGGRNKAIKRKLSLGLELRDFKAAIIRTKGIHVLKNSRKIWQWFNKYRITTRKTILDILKFEGKITDMKNSPRTLMTIFKMATKIINESEEK